MKEKKDLLEKYSNITNKSEGEHKPKGMPGFRGPMGMHFKEEKGKNSDYKEPIKRIFSYIGSDKIKIIIVLIFVILATISNLLAGYMIKPVLNLVSDSGISSEKRIEKLLMLLLFMAFIYFLGVVFSYLQQKIMVKISQNAIKKIREELFSKMQKLPLKYHDENQNGELMGRFTNDLESVGEMLNNTVIQIISGVISLFGTVVLMLYTNVFLAIITIFTMPILKKAAGLLSKLSHNYYKEQQIRLGAVNAYIEETISGQKVVKVFSHEERAIEEFSYLSDELREKQIKAQFYGGIMGPVMGNLSQISFSITAVTGAIMCVNNLLSIGGLALFTQYSKQFSRPINEISMQINTVFAALAGANRVFEILDLKDEDDLGTKNEKITGVVEIKNLSFGYAEDKNVLSNINLLAKKGEKIAFVGSTGAGKTTITNLLNRFYDIKKGEILIDGINIKEFKKDFLRGNIAMVLQDTHLFNETVMENIRYGNLLASDEDVINAAKTASAHSFIMRLESGYNTIITKDGSNLSQGQRQLLNIARAAISKAPILILDEATSSVDTRTEKHIEKGMDGIMKDRTTFVIAHRLSTVRDADKIMVLEKGEIIERGKHYELLDKKGRYYELYSGIIELD